MFVGAVHIHGFIVVATALSTFQSILISQCTVSMVSVTCIPHIQGWMCTCLIVTYILTVHMQKLVHCQLAITNLWWASITFHDSEQLYQEIQTYITSQTMVSKLGHTRSGVVHGSNWFYIAQTSSTLYPLSHSHCNPDCAIHMCTESGFNWYSITWQCH